MHSRKCVLKDLNGKSKNKNETMHWEVSWKRCYHVTKIVAKWV